MTAKVLFLDIDGPMIPHRAYLLPDNHTRLVRLFDPVAVAMVLHLVVKAPAKLVISSAWAMHEGSLDRLIEDFAINGIRFSRYVHADWRTPRGGTLETRSDEILAWLAKHPEVTHWTALDDEETPAPGGVLCDFTDGLLMRHFDQAGDLLGIDNRILHTQRIEDAIAEARKAA